MSQLSNLTDAVTTLSRSVDALVALPTTGTGTGATDAQLSAVTANVSAQINRIDAFVAAAGTVATPSPSSPATASSGLAQATHG